MDFLRYINYKVKERGLEYRKEGRVIELNVEDKNVTAIVTGNNDYYVVLNLDTPKGSRCSCPYAQDGHMCKHIAATYFALFEEEANAFEKEISKSQYDYHDEEDDYFYMDHFDDEDYYDDAVENNFFIKPLFYDELLDDFLNELNEEELRKILRTELNKNEKLTYFNYLEEHYNNIKKVNEYDPKIMLDELYTLISINTKNGYWSQDFLSFSFSEKEMINKLYFDYPYYHERLKDILLNEKFLIHSASNYVVNFYLDKLCESELRELDEVLLNLLKELKKTNISGSKSKSNLLINSYIIRKHLMELDLDFISESLIKNAKYKEYVLFVINEVEDKNKLFKEYLSKLETLNSYNKIETVDALEFLYENTKNNTILKWKYFYDLLFKENINSIQKLKEYKDFDVLLNKIIDRCKKDYLLEKIFISLDMKKELFELYYNKQADYKLIEHAKYLSTDYKEELVEYFKERFLKLVENATKKDEYYDVCKYIKGITLCDDEKTLSELYAYVCTNFPRRKLLIEIFEETRFYALKKRLNIWT